ncbi:Serine/threonine-protein kinase MRCK alpha [Portunus trituberculatus]|uniref:Serine/threonine-protein kinase MRCK alpha n=1 Tax=Portunus trituberculatus TaxID=210409 RepID=A0A5B7I7S5_PORTR|nr:Serine/threonine-protein kinase MRCK alpha [Portunus trituberculatus]
MRDEQFEVSTVRDSDVIHANKKDIPCIFRQMYRSTLSCLPLALSQSRVCSAVTSAPQCLRHSRSTLVCVNPACELIFCAPILAV